MHLPNRCICFIFAIVALLLTTCSGTALEGKPMHVNSGLLFKRRITSTYPWRRTHSAVSTLIACESAPSSNDAVEAPPRQNKYRGSVPRNGIQFMITRKMRDILEKELGYLPEEVDALEPGIAAVVIEKSLVRPENGMPVTWRRPVQKPSSFLLKFNVQPYVQSLQKSFNNVARIIKTQAAAIAVTTLVLATALIIRESGYDGQDLMEGVTKSSVIILRFVRGQTLKFFNQISLKKPSKVKKPSLDLNLFEKVQNPTAFQRARILGNIIWRKLF